MIIGKYVFKKSKTIRNRLVNNQIENDEIITRMLQVYNSRLFGICFYRTEKEFYKDKKEILTTTETRNECKNFDCKFDKNK